MGTDYQSSYTVEVDGSPVSTITLCTDNTRVRGSAVVATVDVPLNEAKAEAVKLREWVQKITGKAPMYLGSNVDIPAEFRMHNGGASLTMTLESGSMQRDMTITKKGGVLVLSLAATDAFDVDLRSWYVMQLAFDELCRSAEARIV